MIWSRPSLTLAFVAVLAVCGSPQASHAQSFGIELHNTLMPVSGAMAGVSLAAPQDVQSAIKGNPATLTQLHGTQFSMSGAWVEPTYSIGQPVALPALGVTPYAGKSDAQGIAAGNIGVTQDFSALGFPITAGLGLFAGAGAGVDFRHIPASNGTHATIVALDIVVGAGVDLTDRLSVGATLLLGSATLDGPFAGTTSSTADFALGGSAGVSYQLTPNTVLGVNWKSKKNYRFENLVSFGGAFLDVDVDRPQVLGFGVANDTLMDGKLLVAADVLYQQHSDANFFQEIYTDQWVFQFGTQYSPNSRVSLRLGYAYNENPMRNLVPDNAGGIFPPGGVTQIQYVQAQFAAIPQHRITGGIGIHDVLPGIDFDLFAGGMFEESQTFGTTTATIQSYWIGAATTWRFGRGACEKGKWCCE